MLNAQLMRGDGVDIPGGVSEARDGRAVVTPTADVESQLAVAEDADGRSQALIQRVLRSVRQHLGVDVVFIGEMTDRERIFRFVDSKPGIDVISPGDSDPVDGSYCYHVLNGTLPNYMLDPSTHPFAAGLPVTKALPVGTHLSVPITTPSGREYGTLCCFSLEVDPSVQPRDVRALELVADLTGEYLDAIDTAADERRQRERIVQSVIDDPTALAVVFQPLRDLKTMGIVGVEALSRFRRSDRGPDWWFSEAAAVGLGVELEMLAVRAALSAFDGIPHPVRLNINVSPDTLYAQEFLDTVSGFPRDRLVVEVTEHAAIDDYTQLRYASAALTDMGIMLAIDDVGMGFSGLNRILESSPDELKLDRSVVRDIDTSPVKRALVQAFCSFGQETGFGIVAEGIETAAELATLQTLCVDTGQGYHLGRPDNLEKIRFT